MQIKALKGAEAVDSAPHKKLFPEIERSTAAEAPKPEIPKVEQEIQIVKNGLSLLAGWLPQ